MRILNNICIIDDDPITVFGIRKMLGLAVQCNDISSYANGKLAFDGIQKIYRAIARVPEILFLDINMPIMDGWQFLEAFIALPLDQKVRINIVTSSIDPLDLQRYERYKKLTEHTLSYNRKPLKLETIEEITIPA